MGADFPLLQRRMVGGVRGAIARSIGHPAQFVAFDVPPTPAQRDVGRRPLVERRRLVEVLLSWPPPASRASCGDGPALTS